MQKHVNIVDLVKGFAATLYKVQMQRNTAMMMVTNGKMMTPIGPDITAPVNAEEAQGWLPKERGRKCGARTPQKGLFRRSGDTETEQGESSTQKESEARVIPVA